MRSLGISQLMKILKKVKEMLKKLMNGWKISCSYLPPTLLLMTPLRSPHSSLKIRLKMSCYAKFSTSSRRQNSHHSPPTLLVNTLSDAPSSSLFTQAIYSNVEALVLQPKSSLIPTSACKSSVRPMKILATVECLEYFKLSEIASIGLRCIKTLLTTFVPAMNVKFTALAKLKFPSPSLPPLEST